LQKFDDGSTASRIAIVDGIPQGNWISYGYQGEEIQTSYCRQLSLRLPFYVHRVTYCLIKEGSFSQGVVFIIVREDDSSRSDKEFENLVRALIKNSEGYKGEIDIKYVRGELETE